VKSRTCAGPKLTCPESFIIGPKYQIASVCYVRFVYIIMIIFTFLIPCVRHFFGLFRLLQEIIYHFRSLPVHLLSQCYLLSCYTLPLNTFVLMYSVLFYKICRWLKFLYVIIFPRLFYSENEVHSFSGLNTSKALSKHCSDCHLPATYSSAYSMI
jgi:hypothetical protein